jgi:hypothetical protein
MPKGTAADPTFLDLTTRECINVRCRCGREVALAPFQLVGNHGITKHTRIFEFKEHFRCRVKSRRKQPERAWISKWRD